MQPFAVQLVKGANTKESLGNGVGVKGSLFPRLSTTAYR